MKISKHITYKEAVKSNTATKLGIINTPSTSDLQNMTIVADKVFEPLREWYGKPIRINSFYRSPELNKAVGGSNTSQHIKGEAIDIDAGKDNHKLFNWIKDNLEYDQLIWEKGTETNPSWVHVSYSKKNRNKIIYIK